MALGSRENLFIGFESAREHWSSSTAPNPESLRRSNVSFKNCCCSIRQIDRSGFNPWLYGIMDETLHVLCAEHREKRTAKRVECHLVSAGLPSRSFYELEHGVYVASPELVFLQMATRLTLVGLIMLGYELCGTYALCPADPRGFIEMPKRTTVRKLRAYLRRVKGIHGVKLARRALRYIVDGSHSPMETITAVLLGLPKYLGGYGFPRFTMNEEITVKGKAAEVTSSTCFYCDLLWDRLLTRQGRKQRFKVAVEYDSSSFHKGRRIDDQHRVDALRLMGYEVVSLNWADVASAYHLRNKVIQLAHLLRFRMRPLHGEGWAKRYDAKQRALRRETIEVARITFVESGWFAA